MKKRIIMILKKIGLLNSLISLRNHLKISIFHSGSRHHWSTLSGNPDSSIVVNRRERIVKNSFSNSFHSYENLIIKYLTGKRVLDFGAANHSINTQHISVKSTHQLVYENASKVYAFDVVKIPTHVNRKDFNCKHFKLNLLKVGRILPLIRNNIDVIFAGHVIEHLSNPGSLFKMAHRSLSKGGELIIVTPNPLWMVGLVARNAGGNASVNADHTSIFGASELIEMGERNNFKIIEWSYAGIDDMSEKIELGLLDELGYSKDNQDFIVKFYKFARDHSLSFAHNSICTRFERI